MATITPRPSKQGMRYRALVRMRGETHVSTHDTRAEANRWASVLERDILDRIAGKLPKKTLLEAIRRYAIEVSPTKKGARWEKVRLLMFERHKFVRKVISETTAEDIKGFRDERLKVVTGPSVRREMNLLSSVFEFARKEWRWTKFNPCHDVTKPRDGNHRTRIWRASEVAKITEKLGWCGTTPVTSSQYVALAFLACLENGFRASEVLKVQLDVTFFPERGVVELPDSKNDDPREIPLMPRTIELLSLLPASGFPISASVLDVKFREARDAIGLVNVTFHDSRHTAATAVARFVRANTLSVFEFCRMFGWKNINQALTYVNDSAEDISKRLAALK